MEILDVECLERKLRRQTMRTAQEPKAYLELPPQDDRPDRQQDIVKSYRKGGRQFAATEKPSHEDGQQRLEAPERSEPEEDANGDSPCNGMRSVPYLREPLLAAAKLDGEKLTQTAHLDGSKKQERRTRKGKNEARMTVAFAARTYT